MHEPDSMELRRLALAVSVLDDVDLGPTDDGVRLTGKPTIDVSWKDLRRALGGADPGDELGRSRVRAWLRGRRIAADIRPDLLLTQARPVGVPVDHPLHPGLDWVRHRVLGDTLDLGIGFVGVSVDPDEVVIIPQTALTVAGVDPMPWWPVARDYLERMGNVAGARFADQPMLRPIGDCDVVTLLGSRSLRQALCNRDVTGMCAVAAPMRTRGWLELSRIDPAFTAVAAAATAVEDRGFPRPLLLTIDEITMATDGGRPAEIVLRDPAVSSTAFSSSAGLPRVRYRP